MNFATRHDLLIKLTQLTEALIGDNQLFVELLALLQVTVLSPFLANRLIDAVAVLGRVRFAGTQQLLVEAQEGASAFIQ